MSELTGKPLRVCAEQLVKPVRVALQPRLLRLR
jgi:hypothetical protein